MIQKDANRVDDALSSTLSAQGSCFIQAATFSEHRDSPVICCAQRWDLDPRPRPLPASFLATKGGAEGEGISGQKKGRLCCAEELPPAAPWNNAVQNVPESMERSLAKRCNESGFVSNAGRFLVELPSLSLATMNAPSLQYQQRRAIQNALEII